jgi:hypothetical protein
MWYNPVVGVINIFMFINFSLLFEISFDSMSLTISLTC